VVQIAVAAAGSAAGCIAVDYIVVEVAVVADHIADNSVD